MKLTTSVLMLALVASASAQAPKTANTQAKPAASTPAKTNTTAPAKTTPASAPSKSAQPIKATTTSVKTTTPAKAPVKAAQTAPAPKTAPKAVPVKKQAPKAPAKPAVKAVKKAPAKKTSAPKPAVAKNEGESTKQAVSVSKNRRDPFLTVIVDRNSGACAGGGKQCLAADEVALKGIVRANGGMIAVVTNKENRAYFLRENDPVLNGVVIRITEGSITFREKSTDVFGKQVTREVVKKINPTAA